MKVAAWIWLLALAVRPAAAADANVVLISIDTLRPDHLGCYGYPKPTSPRIDSFRQDAILFEQAISQAPSTLPSHASIFTSLWPRHHDASHLKRRGLASGFVTLAEVLRDHGYATASFNGGAQLDGAFGLDQGFQLYRSGHRDDFAANLRAGLDWIRDADAKKFFLFLHTYAVHHPYDSGRTRLFETDYRGSLPEAISLELLRSINLKRLEIDDRDLAHIIAAYDGEIRAVDEAFGAFVDQLRARGLYDRTLIVLFSDHGEEFGEHGRVGWHSHSLYDELLRIPLLVKLPGSRHAGKRVSAQVRAIDVAPTVLASVGIEPPDEFQGIDLLRLVQGEAVGPLISFSNLDGGRPLAVRSAEWKLYGRKLFHLAADPREQVDVSAKHPDVKARLRSELERLLATEKAIAAPAAKPDPETLERLRSLGYVR